MKNLLPTLIVLFGSFSGLACTTFLLNKNGQLVFGRNYDWVTGAGIVHSNQRGLFKTSSLNGDEPAISWVSRYGSISFNQYGKEFPTGGMNEKGLVVELMWLEGTQYPDNDSRPAVNVLQWIQYQLDNCASTKEVIATDNKLRITKNGTPLHYLVADASGNVATIEFLEGRMVVHQGDQLPFAALTNSTYTKSSRTAGTVLKSKEQNMPPDNSLERFVKVCSMINKLEAININTPLTEYAFSILKNVSQGSFTKWSIVYDINNREILFRTADNSQIRKVRFSGFDFSCSKSPRMYDMEKSGNGDITAAFQLPDKNIKRRSIEKAVRESNSRVQIDEIAKEKMLHFEDEVTCREVSR